MCGIAGYFGPNPPLEQTLHRAANSLIHRGPDGSGVYRHVGGSGHGVGLLHRRLAIIDLDPRSNQPFRLGDGVLVFNGEIYNYIEVRKELQKLGHSFRTSGDTEVLATALLQWGVDCLDKLEGMWAFAWYREAAGTLILSRDRFGEKPFYLWRRDRAVYFGSEVKALAALVGEWPRINQKHLLRYLINGYKALYKTKETFFLGVQELEAGACLTLTFDRAESVRHYWKPRPVENQRMSYSDAVAMTRDALIDSVNIRMRADVPLAFCMSGGVDSNSLISIAHRRLGCDVHGFTIMNTDTRYEEGDLVDYSVNDLGIQHTKIYPEKSGFLDNLKKLVDSHDAPVSTISYYVHWLLMQAISERGYKVTVSGTGADELFTGYYDHHNLFLYEMSNDPTAHAIAKTAWQKHLSGVVRNPYLKDPDLYIKNPRIRDHIYLGNEEFSAWLHVPWKEPFTEQNFVPGLLRNRMMNELFAEAVPVILHEDDHNAMHFSMENRSPFLDRKLFDIAYSIPVQHLIKDGHTKAVLRDSMRGIVPDAILESRRKVGFNAPIGDLINLKQKNVREYILEGGPVYDIVKRGAVEGLLNRGELPNSVSKFIFYFLNLKFFLDKGS